MKELSIEEKAERYDEVLSMAKEWYNNPNSSSIGKSYLYAVFPELKESEDDKMRKAIHIYLDWLDGRKDYQPKGDYTIRDMIAWLEKQGEKPTDEEMKETLRTEYEKGRADVIAEMRKLVWSEKDTEISSMLIELVESKEESMEAKVEFITWLRTLKNKLLPKPKQEWSEEDEKTIVKMRDFFIRVLGDKPDFTEDKRYEEFIEFIDNRLKSLKDRYTWKPSDE